MESGCYIIIQINIHVPFLGDLFIPNLYLFPDPVGENGAEDGRTNIAYPVTADLMDFSFIRQVSFNIIRLSPTERCDLLEC